MNPYDQSQYDAVMNTLDNARPVGAPREPYLSEGNHQLSILAIEPYHNRDKQFSMRAVFLVEQSTTHAPGSIVAQTWNLVKRPVGENMTSDSERFADFVCKMQGIKLGEHRPSCAALIQQVGQQPARGMRINATGMKLVGKTTGKPYTAFEWQNVPQDQNDRAQNRARLDSIRPYTPRQQYNAQPQYQQPAPQYAQPQGFAPPQPAQGFGYGQPAQPPPGQWGQPAPQPAYPQQGFAPPPAPAFGQPAPAPQTAQPMQQVPPGGFLATLPPNGNGQR